VTGFCIKDAKRSDFGMKHPSSVLKLCISVFSFICDLLLY
jgi:hypothetical protein